MSSAEEVYFLDISRVVSFKGGIGLTLKRGRLATDHLDVLLGERRTFFFFSVNAKFLLGCHLIPLLTPSVEKDFRTVVPVSEQR